MIGCKSLYETVIESFRSTDKGNSTDVRFNTT